MIAFETLHPMRLGGLVGGEERAGAIFGPAAAAAWGLFAAAFASPVWPAAGSGWPGRRCWLGCSTGRSWS